MNFQNQIDYLQTVENLDMFNNCSAPDPINMDTLKSAIVIRCGLLEPQYSEPKLMRLLVANWFTKHQWTFKHLINIILAEYSPIENTDRYSEHTEERAGSNTNKTTASGTDNREIQNSGTDTNTGRHSGTDTTENTVSAFNSSSYQADNKSELTHGETLTETLQHGKKIADTLTHGKTSTTTGSDNGTTTYTEHTHGNIGVTTNQDMITQELELLQRFNIYDWIASRFEAEMMIQVY